MRSTITVTDFIILFETTIPFRGFTIVPLPRGLRAHAPHTLARPRRWPPVRGKIIRLKAPTPNDRDEGAGKESHREC